MMEEGFNPSYEKGHILFSIEDNIVVLEYEECVLSIRIFFSIDENGYDLFLEASNAAMLDSLLVKSVIMENQKNIMFSFETLCCTAREFRKYIHQGICYLMEGIGTHMTEMKELMATEKISSVTLAATEDISIISDSKRTKPLS